MIDPIERIAAFSAGVLGAATNAGLSLAEAAELTKIATTKYASEKFALDLADPTAWVKPKTPDPQASNPMDFANDPDVRMALALRRDDLKAKMKETAKAQQQAQRQAGMPQLPQQAQPGQPPAGMPKLAALRTGEGRKAATRAANQTMPDPVPVPDFGLPKSVPDPVPVPDFGLPKSLSPLDRPGTAYVQGPTASRAAYQPRPAPGPAPVPVPDFGLPKSVKPPFGPLSPVRPATQPVKRSDAKPNPSLPKPDLTAPAPLASAAPAGPASRFMNDVGQRLGNAGGISRTVQQVASVASGGAAGIRTASATHPAGGGLGAALRSPVAQRAFDDAGGTATTVRNVSRGAAGALRNAQGVAGNLAPAARGIDNQLNTSPPAPPVVKKSDDSSLAGRYLAMQALHSQARTNTPLTANAADLGSQAVPGLNILAAPFVQGHAVGMNPAEASVRLRGLVDAAKKRKGDFGASFGHGFERRAPSGALIGGAVGGLLGAAGGGANSGPGGALIGGLGGLLGGGLLGGLSLGTGGGLSSALSDTILARTSDDSNRRAIGTVSRRPMLTALPFGTAVGALGSREDEPDDKKKGPTKQSSLLSLGQALRTPAPKSAKR